MNERELILYERAGCALCEQMASALQRELVNSHVSVRRVNIDADNALKARFDWDVPLLFAGGTEICRHRLDTRALKNWLTGVQKQPDSCWSG